MCVELVLGKFDKCAAVRLFITAGRRAVASIVAQLALIGQIQTQPVNLKARQMTQTRLIQKNIAVALLAAITIWAGLSHGAVIYVPNGSFETPTVPPVNPFAQPDMDFWQKSPQ